MFLHQLPLTAAASLIAFSYNLKALELADIGLLDEVTESIGDVTEEANEGIDSLSDSRFGESSLDDFPGLSTILVEPAPEADQEFDDEDVTEPDMIESEVSDVFDTELPEKDRPLALTE